MQLHQLKPAYKLKKKKRIGRGGKKGTYSGKGLKGQKSRSGHRFAPVIRELIKKHPKLRGYRTKIPKKNIVVVNLDILTEKFKETEVISPESLLKRKLIRRIGGKVPKVKILARGKISKKLTIEKCEVSKSAKKKIKEAGGAVEIPNSQFPMKFQIPN